MEEYIINNLKRVFDDNKNPVISKEYVKKNCIPIEFINEQIQVYKDCIKKAKPDDLMLIEYYEDRIEELKRLIANWRLNNARALEFR